MAATHGSKASLLIGTLATPAVVTDVSVYTNTASVALTRDNAETTTLQKNSKTYIPGLKDGTFPMGGPLDPTIEQILWDLHNTGTIVNFEYWPSGVTGGGKKYAGTGFITSFDPQSPVGDTSSFSAAFQITGDVTRV
jgi:hypothetical protein